MSFLLKPWIAGLLLLCPVSCRTVDRGDTNIMIYQLDVIHYRIRMDIDNRDQRITGTTDIQFRALKNLTRLAFNFEGLQIDSCRMDNREVQFNRKEGFLWVVPGNQVQAGSHHIVTVKYSGIPSDGLIIGQNKYGHFSAFSDNWANRARHWFPSIDHPSDKASVSFEITVPAGYEVVANGNTTKTTTLGGRSTYFFEEINPIPTYCMVVGVCDFSIHPEVTPTDVPLTYYTFPEDSLQAVLGFARAVDMVQFYDSLVGPYPYSKLALVQSSTRFGGMENASAIFFPEDSPLFAVGDAGEVTLAHEIAHQWFGDAITQSDWSELWLSEGFATYFSFLYFEAKDGTARFDELLTAARNRYEKQSSKSRPVIDTGYAALADLLNVENYQKGALFLHALRIRIGDEAWFSGIRRYYKGFKHGNATTADFEQIMSEASDTDLKPFFDRWLTKPGIPE